jgi:enhancer of polycomb-like protein
MSMKNQAQRSANLPESDLVYLQDLKEKKEIEIQRFIDENIARHQNWNKNMVDITWRPITPPLETGSRSSYRGAVTTMLPTPPSSESSEQSGENAPTDDRNRRSLRRNSAVTIRYASPPEEDSNKMQTPRFRRRMGRGGRLMIDRRGIKREYQEIDEDDLDAQRRQDRCAFDRDSDDEETPKYASDFYNDMHMRYRILLRIQAKEGASMQHRRIAAEHQHVSPSHNRSSSGHLLPPSG